MPRHFRIDHGSPRDTCGSTGLGTRFALWLTVCVAPAASAGASEHLLYAFDNLAEGSGGVGDALVVFDPQDPANVIELGRTGVVHTAMTGLEFTPDGRLWACGAPTVSDGTAGIFSISIDTGVASFIGTGGVEADRRLTDLAYNPADGQMYAAAHRLGLPPQLYTIDLSTGVATLVGDLQGETVVPYGLAADSQGSLYVMGAATTSDRDGLYRLDGLQLVQVIDLPFEILFSQGIAIDWSAAFGGRDAGFHGAMTEDELVCELWRFDPHEGLIALVGGIGPLHPGTGRSVREVGDVAIRPRRPAENTPVGQAGVPLSAERVVP